jgi:hypothetical protein
MSAASLAQVKIGTELSLFALQEFCANGIHRF